MNSAQASIAQVEINNEVYYKIANSDSMRPFFISIVSDSNHWMFISSNGGLSAGRKNAEHALFPYYTDDKITESVETTGSKSIFRVQKNGQTHLWEPFSMRGEGRFNITRNLYKNRYGNKILFEEINNDLGLSFRYEWCSSNQYGFVRKSSLKNISSDQINIDLVDGIQNIMPSAVPSYTQNNASNLVNAYKRSELESSSGMGIYALSAVIVDKAEPSEALKANIVWSKGFSDVSYLMSSTQLDAFRSGQNVTAENDIKGERGAYFMNARIDLNSQESKDWFLVADVNQTHSKVVALIHSINNNSNLADDVFKDIEIGTEKLIALNASADGIQCTSDKLRDTRHFSNVLFNNMRGGIFDENYNIEKWDFLSYVQNANKSVYSNNKSLLESMPDLFSLQQMQDQVNSIEDADLKRLSIEYLPIKFSRRHGDPSRPWNRFSINMINENDGSKVLDYEGNWRDIFQNWEAMVHAFPDFIEGMIFRFLNASTFDGYNPYRITKGGFDWEVIEPDDPWSYIGYWGDHQIIYLLKFLEFIEKHNPGKLHEYFDKDLFVYANVPYRIKPYSDILKNPKDTISFDEEDDHKTRTAMEALGADGGLLKDENGEIHRVNFIEKILATVLAKISNFVPEAGIWMNTQRPEWNDANNALVGNGVSMVTLYYLKRFLKYFEGLVESAPQESISLSNELMDFYKQTRKTLEDNLSILDTEITDSARKDFMDQLGEAASNYREHIYQKSFWGTRRTISKEGLLRFITTAQSYIDHSIDANKRSDGLYHAYNLITISESEVEVSYLSEMLEGQVAVLSSGYLDAKDALAALDAMKDSALFRHDQYSYLLYPNKKLSGFLERNNIPDEEAGKSDLINALLLNENNSVVEKDINGQLHFNGNFRNVKDMHAALDDLDKEKYGALIQSDRQKLAAIFEAVFNHKSFTGRSGTFYGYEGLGSIYWHMVSKLLLAVQETCVSAINNSVDDSTTGRLLEHFYEINEGIGVHKPPSLYGAFPTDPYSHTPWHKGAQQPGMTGQVKEDILSRFGELGVFVQDGQIQFNPCLLRQNEFLHESTNFNYLDIHSNRHSIILDNNSLGFTYCQVPIIYRISENASIKVNYTDQNSQESEGHALTKDQSQSLFQRKGDIQSIEVFIQSATLK